MPKYVALLRGINVGGNNKVSMAELKLALTQAGLKNVRTYINSGNVLFESEKTNVLALTEQCEHAIEKKFGFAVGCAVLPATLYKQLVDNAPKWWGNSREHTRSDALFVLRHGSAQAVRDKIGEIAIDNEWLDCNEYVLYWTVDMRHYGRARLPKIIGSDEYRTISMRSSTTTRKLYDLLDA